jgi:hypothetical protein
MQIFLTVLNFHYYRNFRFEVRKPGSSEVNEAKLVTSSDLRKCLRAASLKLRPVY